MAIPDFVQFFMQKVTRPVPAVFLADTIKNVSENKIPDSGATPVPIL